MDKFGIDSHKLNYHVTRVSDWLNGQLIYPVYMEISPSGMCNHRCSFCALDFMGYEKKFLDSDVLCDLLTELGTLGLKSVMFGGEGEPFLHKEIVSFSQIAKNAGIDVAFTTNGVFFNEEKAQQILPLTEWIKVSINAGSAATYGLIHNTKPADFDKVVNNLTRAAAIKNENGYSCTLGMQILLLPENRDEIMELARIARDTGIDYLVVKPYSQHPASITDKYKNLKYTDVSEIAEEVESFNSDSFQTIVRLDTMKKWDEKERKYSKCLALPFWSYIDSRGNVWGCSIFLGDERFLYGNIYKNSFLEIWQGEKRKESLRWVEEEMSAAKCRINCRMDKVNSYLWNLKHPPDHVNFI